MLGDSQISLIKCRTHLVAAMQLTVRCCELYFVRCCAMKRTGTFAELESMALCFIIRSGVLKL